MKLGITPAVISPYVLRKIGESAEMFDDHSPLQLGAAVVGRLVIVM